MKRILLFLATNIAVMVVLAIVTQVLGVDPKTSGGLVIFSAVIGFTGSIFSLLLSKQIAKWSTPGFRTIEQPQTAGNAEYQQACKVLEQFEQHIAKQSKPRAQVSFSERHLAAKEQALLKLRKTKSRICSLRDTISTNFTHMYGHTTMNSKQLTFLLRIMLSLQTQLTRILKH